MPTEAELTSSSPIDTALATQGIAEQENIIFPKVNQRQLALDDIKDGFKKWQIWLMLAYQDIKLRYRRSVLGPFWLTISMAITVYSMGYLYAHLFKVEFQRYYPFLVAGMLGWSLISTIILELTDGLIAADGFIKQIKLPYSLYIHRIAARNILIFFHNILVIVPILIIFHEYAKISPYTLLLIPGLIAIYINTLSFGLILGMIGARYRDIAQIIKSLVQIVFFVTPVMWRPDVLSEKTRYFVDFNPFYAFIELIRAPLLGNAPTLNNLIVVTIVTLVGISICALIFTRYRSRIVYWL